MSKLIQILYPVVIFVFLVIFSWVLIHLLTVFGVFLAIAYPIWWIIAPKQTICIFCRSRKEGSICIACHEVVHKSEGIFPKTFNSAIHNALVLLCFSIISIGLVFVEGQVLFHLGFSKPAKTVSFSIPSQQQHGIGEVFPMQIKIMGIKESINVVRADFSFDPSMLEVVDISIKDSFANIFIQKQIDNKNGFVRFAGGLPNPGYSGSDGIFATIYLRGFKTGIATIHFLPSSVVLANNGKGDNLLGSFSDVSYLIAETLPRTSQQKSASLESEVLGASTSATKMIFYDKDQVLTASRVISSVSAQANSKAIVMRCLSVLSGLDKYALSIWSKIL